MTGRTHQVTPHAQHKQTRVYVWTRFLSTHAPGAPWGRGERVDALPLSCWIVSGARSSREGDVSPPLWVETDDTRCSSELH